MSASILPNTCEANFRWDDTVSGKVSYLEANGTGSVSDCRWTSNTSYHDCQPSKYPDNQGSWTSFFRRNSISASGNMVHHAPWPPQSSQSSYRDTEDTLFMQYLDRVFYIQFPFYSTSKRRRDWLFAILRRAKPAYHATLALSQYFQYSVRPQDNNFAVARSLRNFQTEDGHYHRALRELQISIGQSPTWGGMPGLIYSMEALTCILQLLFLEVSLLPLLYLQERN